MQRRIGVILAGLGAFLIALALLSRFWAYGAVATVPLDQESISYSVGQDATVFSLGQLKEITTDLESKVKVAGDIDLAKEASDEVGEDVAVWEKSVTTNPPGQAITAEEPPLGFSHDLIAFNRYTGEMVDWSGSYISDGNDDNGDEIRDTETPLTGLYFKFPFRTEKKTYPWWDGSLKESRDIAYESTEAIGGLTVYKFVQTIPPTKVAEIDAPASVFGLDQEGDVTLDRVYANTRTLWVEPETGVLIRVQEDQNVVAEYDGEQVATLTKVVSGFDQATIDANVDEYGAKATQLKAVRVWVPLFGGLLGVGLLVVGPLLVLRARREAVED